MNGTPRTDQMEQHAPVGLRRNSAFEQASDLCRQLERELNVANADVERLTKANLQLREGCEGLKQRINRLETAGDRLMENHYNLYRVREWLKAKEVKL